MSHIFSVIMFLNQNEKHSAGQISNQTINLRQTSTWDHLAS